MDLKATYDEYGRSFWGLDTPLKWFDSAVDKCNLRRAVLALVLSNVSRG